MAQQTKARAKKAGAAKKTATKPAAAKRTSASGNARKTAARQSNGSAARSGGKAGAKPSKLTQVTTDHEEIRSWAESRGAKPACVKGTGRKKGDIGMIRLDFPGYSGAGSLLPISWEDWFESFDENGLALIYQDKTAAGRKSNFNKLVSRESQG